MIKIYNTLTKSKEEFKPIKEGEVGIYSCGPTVYNYVHIGNLRAYLFADLLHRAFIYNGYKVNHIMNITDVDDKTIRDSRATGLSLNEFTEKYTKAFFEDLDKLNINRDEYVFPRATENIEGMIELIQKLLDKGIAYKAEDGSVYFDISKFPDYGKLSGVDFERDTKSRISNDEYAKDEAHDFALWKAWDEKDGDVAWDAPFGRGRPGWHIECSVMSSKNIANHFDIHTGGIDLIFPHHENEIAQSEAANDEKFVNYWVHNEMLMVNGQKMSKSLKNDYKMKDLEKEITLTNTELGEQVTFKPRPIDFRFLCLITHYRQKLNFLYGTEPEGQHSLYAAQQGLNNIINKVKALGVDMGEINKDYKEKFLDAVNDDLNSPKALAVLQEVLKSDIPDADKLATVLDFDKVLGLKLDEVGESDIEVPQEVIDLAEERKKAKEEKDFAKADEIRGKIEEMGFMVEDLSGGEYKIIKRN